MVKERIAYARSIINNILREEVDNATIIDAIKKRHPVRITYSDEPIGPRDIMPVAYGLSVAGNPMIRAYQTDGVSSENTHGWKTFRVDRIGQWTTDKSKVFDQPPLYPGDGQYNGSGDEKFSQIYVSADFTNAGRGSDIDSTEPKQVPSIQEPVEKSNISGMDYTEKGGSNRQNTVDMSNTRTFGDENDKPSNGPVFKSNTEEETPNEEKPDYSNVSNDGPIYKNKQEPFGNVNFVDDED